MNVLFIAVDDLRPELGCYGNSYLHTPHLDRLAAQGRLFQHHYVQVPTCGASRYALLTGLRPRRPLHLRNQVMFELMAGEPEPEQPESFAHLFRRKGYFTAAYGKISHSPDGYVYEYPEPPSDTLEMPHSWDEVYGPQEPWGTGWRAFFAYANGRNRIDEQRQVKPYERLDVPDEAYPDGLIAAKAVEQLKQLSQADQPFLLAVGFYKPHLPFCAPARYWDLYDSSALPLSPNPFLPENVHPSSLQRNGEFNHGYQQGDERAELGTPVSKGYARRLKHAYAASVSYVDAQIGKVLDVLAETGLSDNTVVVVWGDHGWHLGDHTVWGKHTLFERALRSTLILRTPDMPQPGTSTHRVVESVDLYPTLLELCGLEAEGPLDGQSMVPLLHDPQAPFEEAAYSYWRKGMSLRTPRYRLTRHVREEEPVTELFDHQTDPHETKNIAQAHPALVDSLLRTWEQGKTGLLEEKSTP